MNSHELATPGETNDSASTEAIRPWEEIASGRYMPRRIRGSLRGRVLG